MPSIPKISTCLMADSDAAKAGRTMSAMMKMKKLDLAKLTQAHAH